LPLSDYEMAAGSIYTDGGEKMIEALIFSFLATICFGLVLKTELPPFWSFTLVVMGIIFAVIAIFYAIEYIDATYTEHIRMRELAKVEAPMLFLQVANASGPAQLDAMRRFQTWDISGTIGNDGVQDFVTYTLHLPQDDIPLELLRLFLVMSDDPFLCPIDRHDDVIFKDFINVEKRLTVLTNEFIRRGWADKASGPYPARLKSHLTIEHIADIFEVEL